MWSAQEIKNLLSLQASNLWWGFFPPFSIESSTGWLIAKTTPLLKKGKQENYKADAEDHMQGKHHFFFSQVKRTYLDALTVNM